MRTDAEEFAALGRLIGERLTAAKGPVRVLVPLSGFSGLTGRRLHDLDGRELGPWAQPETDQVFVETLRAHMAAGTVIEAPLHINDPRFADLCVDTLLQWLPASAASARR
jgi:uncharacterized protein (UPF0261 family)